MTDFEKIKCVEADRKKRKRCKVFWDIFYALMLGFCGGIGFGIAILVMVLAII
jgi:hypothetical protein